MGTSGPTRAASTSSPARILIVDDEPYNILLLERVLQRGGYEIASTTDPRQAVAVFADFHPDLVLLDLRMPNMDGFEVMARLRSAIGVGEYLPILMLTGDQNMDTKHRALTSGAKDFIGKPFNHSEVCARVENLLETRSLHRQLRIQNESLEEAVQKRTVSLESAIERLQDTQNELKMSREETIHRLSLAAESRDAETARHVRRMGTFCGLLAERLGHNRERSELIWLASQMHDIGKIGIPDHILLKEGPLQPNERLCMEKHAEIGYKMLVGSNSELLELAATIAYTHHERYDGSGYPRGLIGHEIPVEGRIAAIADVFDAVTSDRVYRKAHPVGRAVQILTDGRGVHFDPLMLDVFVDSIDDLLRIRELHGEDATQTPFPRTDHVIGSSPARSA